MTLTKFTKATKAQKEQLLELKNPGFFVADKHRNPAVVHKLNCKIAKKVIKNIIDNNSNPFQYNPSEKYRTTDDLDTKFRYQIWRECAYCGTGLKQTNINRRPSIPPVPTQWHWAPIEE